MNFDNLVAIVLAGNDHDPEILGGGHGTSKFFMEFNDGRVYDNIISAVDGLDDCQAIYIVCSPDHMDHDFSTKHAVTLLEQGYSRSENMKIALKAAENKGQYREGDYVLLVMGDLPLLSTESIEMFISECKTAKTSDAYIGLIPAECLDPNLTEYYKQDFLPLNNGTYLHSDVYLVNPSSITELGIDRVETIMNMRRGILSLSNDVVKAGLEIAKIARFKGLLAFGKIITGLYLYNKGNPDLSNRVMGGVETEVKRMIKDFFGPEIEFVYVGCPDLGYEFDNKNQLQALQEHVYN